jgi:hypothetical protein
MVSFLCQSDSMRRHLKVQREQHDIPASEQGRMARGGHGLLKVSLRPTISFLSNSCGRPPLKWPYSCFRGGHPQSARPSAVFYPLEIPRHTPMAVGTLGRFKVGRKKGRRAKRVSQSEILRLEQRKVNDLKRPHLTSPDNSPHLRPHLIHVPTSPSPPPHLSSARFALWTRVS